MVGIEHASRPAKHQQNANMKVTIDCLIAASHRHSYKCNRILFYPE
jgi:hypothetical protein